MQAGMHQRAALAQSRQGLGAREYTEESHLRGDAQLLHQSFQTPPIRTITNDPEFRARHLRTGKGLQPQMKPLPWEQSPNAQESKRVVVDTGLALQLCGILLSHPN